MTNRRDAVKLGISIIGGSLLTSFTKSNLDAQMSLDNKPSAILQSVCRWTMNDFSFEELCQLAVKSGLKAIDLVGPSDWPILKKYNLDSSMCNGAEIGLTKGWNDTQYHEVLVKNYTEYIDLVAKAGYKNLICFSGNRDGMSDDQGLQNCVIGLKKVMAHAERKGVILQMELFNSKVDHPDYMCDSSQWGIELCKALDSDHFKLLYDIYHMQIQEGDIIRTITDYHQYFGHYHTAGVPGRNEIGEHQELNYQAISKAIVKTGFNGYIAHEYISTKSSKKDKIKELKKAINICKI